MDFDQAFDRLIGFEGGYANDSRDPGGETMWGVTRRVAVIEGYHGDMHILPRDTAKDIYRRRYWDAVNADKLPGLLRYAVFDAAVNSGITRAAAWLRQALDLGDDGGVDDLVIKAAHEADPAAAVNRMCGIRLEFLTSLPTWGAFGRGWSRRIAEILQSPSTKGTA
jgi:lysozyme family protein